MGLATGYWLDVEKTRSSFITHPVTKERLYKTGDLGRYLPSGNIEFLGREDFQVKVNGYRIELGEIEITLKQHPAVKEAVVTAVGPERGNKQLVAYVVSHQDGSKTAEAHNPRELEGVILDPVARMEFRLKQPGLRQSLTTQSTLDLALPEFDEGLRRAYLERQSYRQFQTRPISFEQFSQFLSCLLSRQLEDYPLPKYQYPSAGSLYPVQTYLLIKPHRIEGVEAGIYYYQPRDHRLVLLSSTGIKGDVYQGNEAIYEQSAFSLLLIGEMKAISPMYGEMARDFCLLEAGHIGQLLMKAAPQQEIGLCRIGAMEFEEMRQLFNLESSQVLLYSFLGGKIDVEQTKSWFEYQNGREAISVTLRKYLMQKLPEYMVPSTFVLLDALPLTPNGKVDRRALPSPVASRRSELAISDVMPQTESEKIIAGVWQDVLKLEKVGIHANFFDLGGNSLVLVQVRNQLQDIMKRELSIVDLFTFPTIQELAQHLSPEQDLPPGEDETQGHEGNSTVHPVRKTAPTVPDCLVPLQSEGDRLPFFCVHPHAGMVFPYVELARILGRNQPFYGLQSLGLNPGETPLTSISDMAAAYVAAIKTLQPQGPYRVGDGQRAV
ncbi:MAG: SagB family peptide dehydrogenase [Hormoscilla sp. GM7CHS1pb]|nr:SagB family peptide dehydrogenase [Hormoscilla sp. GM7CHS1pb]